MGRTMQARSRRAARTSSRTRARLPALAALCAAACPVPGATTHATTPATGLVATGLSAEHVVREREDGPAVALSRVQISAHGSRTTMLGIARGETYAGSAQVLANDALERLWLIDLRRRIVHRVPLVPGDGAPDPDGAPARPGEVFAFAPCEGLRAGEPQASTWRGRAVSVHACSDAAGAVVSHQAFDADAGIVVRVVAGGGTVHEVRAIRALELDPERFVPDESLREVELEELLGGPAPLATYAGG